MARARPQVAVYAMCPGPRGDGGRARLVLNRGWRPRPVRALATANAVGEGIVPFRQSVPPRAVDEFASIGPWRAKGLAGTIPTCDGGYSVSSSSAPSAWPGRRYLP